MLCRVCAAVLVHCVQVCAECANMAGCAVPAVGLARAAVWENVCVLPCRGMHVQRWAGGYPIFWVKAGMEGC